jgi:hypothetical protein
MENWIAPCALTLAATDGVNPLPRTQPRDANPAFTHGLQSSDKVSQFHGR